MSRWLFAVCCALCLLSFGFVDPIRSPQARPLGGQCDHDRDCQVGLRCESVEGVMHGQCAARCNSTPSCQERFGEQSLCLGADVCARACATRVDCPGRSVCNAYGWCETP